MKQTRLLMGMPITVEIVDLEVNEKAFDLVFDYFTYVDETFSTYKDTSEITKINKGLISPEEYSADMKEVFLLCEKTKQQTEGYFDIVSREEIYDPSGLVKGWSIYNAAKLLERNGYKNFYIDAGGDIQVSGLSGDGTMWRVGIRSPFKIEEKEIVKTLYVSTEGVATSGTYIRGQHIYNPHDKQTHLTDIMSLTVVGKDIYEADRFATAAFAMGRKGIQFIEHLEGFEGYMIDTSGIATMTSNFKLYTKER